MTKSLLGYARRLPIRSNRRNFEKPRGQNLVFSVRYAFQAKCRSTSIASIASVVFAIGLAIACSMPRTVDVD